jgi:hypothetical protein
MYISAMSSAPLSASSLVRAVSAGDVVRSRFSTAGLPLHLGSGRWGGNFDAWGLQNRGEPGGPGADADPARVKTVLTHKDHWHRDGERDRLLPLAQVAFAHRPGRPEQWRQHVALLTGSITTEASGPGWAYRVVVATDLSRPDVLLLSLRIRGAVPAVQVRGLVLRPGREAGTCTLVHAAAAEWTGRVQCLGADSVLAVRVHSHAGSASLATTADGVEVRWSGDGEHIIAIAGGAWARREEVITQLSDLPLMQQRAEESWRARWQRGGWVKIPDAGVQALWARSLFWQFCGNDGSDRMPAPPCGLSGLAWQFAFPQDVSYIHPALLRAGHGDLVAGWIDHWHTLLAEQELWTRTVYRRAQDQAPAAGAGWAMATPIASGAPIPVPGHANHLGFQVHNAVYPARMAWDCARHRADPVWTRDRAWPLIRASARFYTSLAWRGADGLWGLHALPSAGQDEFDGYDQPDYLCALHAARAALTIALAAARDLGIADAELDQWRTILREGLAFARLRTASGVLANSPRFVDGSGFGRQKHPSQFQPLAFTPLPGVDLGPAALAFAARDELCERSGEYPRFGWGWTLPAGMLAATRLGRGNDLADVCSAAELERQCGSDLIAFQESTHPHFGAWYFTTNHGLFLQAVQDCLVDDSFGAVELGRGLPDAWRGARWHGLRTAPWQVQPS